MHALVLAAHGSRRQSSNEEVKALAQTIAGQCRDRYPFVNAGFLELAQPSIPDALRACAEAGATRITLVPYLLAAGRHVVEDIPGEVDSVREELAGVEMTITAHIGASALMTALVLSCADTAQDKR
jgi:sirohydrochlorin ferrochelatase